MKKQELNELAKYRMSRAKETLKEVTLHIENELWNTAVNRLYYACYYAVNALLISKNIKTTTHSGVRQMFGFHFVKKGIVDKELGRFYSDIFDKRQSGDYDDFYEFKKEDIMDLIQPAKKLISTINKLLKE